MLVWLPLNGNINNQGLSNITLTSGTATYKTGKIGQGLNLNSRVAFNCPDLNGCKTFTVCFWVKLEDDSNITSNWQDIISLTEYKADGSSYGYFRCETCYASAYAATNPARGTHWHDNLNYGIADFSFNHYQSGERGVWHHCAVVVNSTSFIHGYTDGVLVYSKTDGMNGGYLHGNFWLGETNAIQGCINDVRIYDHCLSPREIKEISKGLVLHYTLAAPGMENLLKNTNDIVTVNSKSKLYSLSLTPKEFLLQACNKGLTLSYDIHCPGAYPTTTGSYHRLGCYLGCTITNNSTGESNSFYGHHSLSGTPTSQHTLNKTNSLNSVSSSATATNLDLSFNGHYSRTIYPQNSSAVADFYNNPDNYTVTIQGLRSELNNVNVEENTWIKNVKLEFGDKETPWMPNSTDTEYTKMGYNNNIEYDVSGFKNNGVKIGDLTYRSDTPKYNTSTYISATNQKIHISNFPTSGFGNSYSFAWWGKRSSNSPMFWGFSDGNRLNGMYLGYLWNTGDSSSNPLYNIGTTTQVTAPSTGIWHHYVMTGNGTKCYVYLDGELWAEAKTYKPINGTSVYINGWDSGTSYCSSYTLMSDFRIYATALSADDVKELYHTPVTLTSNGVLMTSGEFTGA